MKLGCEDETAATAAVLTSRFFRKLPANLNAVCPFSLATAALYLAGKVHDDFVKIRDAINVAYAALHPGEAGPIEVGELYWAMRDGVGALELLLARTLAFQLAFTHPHLYASQYLDSLRSWCRREKWDQGTPFPPSAAPTVKGNELDVAARVAEVALTLLRDSYIKPELPTSAVPQVFALACISIALGEISTSPYSHREME